MQNPSANTLRIDAPALYIYAHNDTLPLILIIHVHANMFKTFSSYTYKAFPVYISVGRGWSMEGVDVSTYFIFSVYDIGSVWQVRQHVCHCMPGGSFFNCNWKCNYEKNWNGQKVKCVWRVDNVRYMHIVSFRKVWIMKHGIVPIHFLVIFCFFFRNRIVFHFLTMHTRVLFMKTSTYIYKIGFSTTKLWN